MDVNVFQRLHFEFDQILYTCIIGQSYSCQHEYFIHRSIVWRAEMLFDIWIDRLFYLLLICIHLTWSDRWFCFHCIFSAMVNCIDLKSQHQHQNRQNWTFSSFNCLCLCMIFKRLSHENQKYMGFVCFARVKFVIFIAQSGWDFIILPELVCYINLVLQIGIKLLLS